MTRFEPATSGSTDRRSNQLSYIYHKSVLYFSKFADPVQISRLKHWRVPACVENYFYQSIK